MKHPGLKNAFFDKRNPEIFAEGLRTLGSRSIQTAVAVAVKSVLTLKSTRHPFSYPAGFKGSCTLLQQIELAALVVCVRRPRPARRLKSLPFAENKNNEMYVRVLRHRNETCGWHVRAGRVKHAVDLELMGARAGPHEDGAGRTDDAAGGSKVG